MSKCPHTDFRKGQKVFVTLKDGAQMIDKYVETKSGVIILKDHGRMPTKKIRAITIYRNQAVHKNK